MYLKISLILIAGLALGIFLIIVRKFPYLKKLPLNPEQEVAGTFFSDFFPEVCHRLKKVDPGSYRTYFLRESEKFFRRLRVVSLKLESFSNALISKIKTSHHYQKEPGSGAVEEVRSAAEATKVLSKPDPFNYKKEEQSLIIEIAKDPKNPGLYRRLADIYLSLKNYSDARESLETVLKLDPEDEKTKEKLTKIQARLPT